MNFLTLALLISLSGHASAQVRAGSECAGPSVFRTPDWMSELFRFLPGPSRSSLLPEARVDTERLPALTASCRGLHAASQALVTRIQFQDETRSEVISLSRYQMGNGQLNSSSRYAASAVKFLPAVLMAQSLQAQGFSPNVELSFEGYRNSTNLRAATLIEQALSPSDNRAYNHMLAFVSPRDLTARLQALGLGLGDTVLRRAYYRDDWLNEVGGNADFDPLPAIRLNEAGRASQIPARADTSMDAAACGMSSCTSLEDLNTALIAILLQDAPGVGEGFGLNEDWMRVIRGSLSSANPLRRRGHDMVRGLRESLGADAAMEFWSKPGYVDTLPTVSDTAFFYDPRDRRVAWAVTAQIPSADRNDIARLGACLGGVLGQLE
jgi:hypothetical protein